jgi:phosphoglycolate phosphatase
MMFPLILFDLDGTLVDSAPDIAAALNAALAEAGHPTVPAPIVVGYVGDGATKLVERAIAPEERERPGRDEVPDLVERFRHHYAAHVCVRSRLYPDVAETLAQLAEAGVRMAVLTNKPGGLARALLRALALDRFFGDVVGDGDGFPRKPSPEAALHLLARAGVAPDRALVVGDGLADIRVGRAAGCPVAAATWGYTERDVLAAERPDFVLESAAEIVALVMRGR